MIVAWQKVPNFRILEKVFMKESAQQESVPLVSFWYLYCQLWTYFTPCSDVFIVNFEYVNVGWVLISICIYESGLFLTQFWQLVGNEGKGSISKRRLREGESQNGGYEKTKHAKFTGKRTFLAPWYAQR